MATKKKATPHSCTQVLKILKAKANPNTAKIYRNHGVEGPCLGVSYAFLKTLDKKVCEDLSLAQELWDTGVLDARIFACWIAEPDKVRAKLLDSWAKDIDNHVLAHELINLAAFTNIGAAKAKKWREMKAEWRQALGWGIVANLAPQMDRPSEEGGMEDQELGTCLKEIEARVHEAPNWARQKMNAALIAIGCRPSMTKKALAVAKRVGKVQVDRGNTACKTKPALETIEKTVRHYKAKGQTPADGAMGKRRRHC